MQPTLLIFTRGPHAESARRHLLPRQLADWELALHRRCLEEALAAGRDSGCRLEVSSPAPLPLPPGARRSPQRGADFGQRLVTALRDAGRRATGPLVLVGTDSPGLTAGHLRDALARLAGDRQRVVLGPSPDGGFYLLATTQPRRIEPVLARITWCRGDTLAQLTGELEAAGFEIELLAPLADLDRPADLAHWLAERRPAAGWRQLKRRLRQLLAALRRPAAPPRLGVLRPARAPVRRGRAPPASPLV